MGGAKSIFPRGDMIRQAIRWISDIHQYDVETIEEACRRYDLSPCEEEFLLKHFLHADQKRVSGNAKH
ncbi:hypothetical protein Ga0123462_0967 [Mariprofundus ferrinatatus]|uniref:Uncharacterized protein n=1 Tax=Mariprofundus ferrinatatus TaxID=1921087 RepID=A0A2K8LC45_9PROT|nr:hypothetical protein [Mariprofundus ferrinatatus]ATX81836.1 hypothetical protein Ga0123462_0967 [Mariprofundus ferrinatatus]